MVFQTGLTCKRLSCEMLFQSLNRDDGFSNFLFPPDISPLSAVSIPQSGWWFFKLQPRGSEKVVEAGFNPSIGMMVFQTPACGGQHPQCDVSIPQSGWWFFKPQGACRCTHRHAVSIPQSGWWFFKLTTGASWILRPQSFNPSIGMMVFQTDGACCQRVIHQRFQSLNRDDGFSNLPYHL